MPRVRMLGISEPKFLGKFPTESSTPESVLKLQILSSWIDRRNVPGGAAKTARGRVAPPGTAHSARGLGSAACGARVDRRPGQ